jgi:hypothetical protein
LINAWLVHLSSPFRIILRLIRDRRPGVHAIRDPLALVLDHNMVEEMTNINNINAIADDQRESTRQRQILLLYKEENTDVLQAFEDCKK